MDREVFQTNKMILFVIIGIVFVGLTYGSLVYDLPIFFLGLFCVIAVFIVLSAIRTKIVIENGILRYEKVIGGEEVALKHVTQIITREVETIVNHVNERQVSKRRGGKIIGVGFGQENVDQERKVEKVMYILDETGKTIFSVPANLVGFTQRARFKEAILKENPAIEIL